MANGAKAVRTKNAKLTAGNNAYATHAAQGSCPPTCPLLNAGCYAESGPQGIHTSRLNNAASGDLPETIARDEANAIDALPFDPKAAMLRLHVVGDCSTEQAARIVAPAAERWQERNNAPAFGYTHAWRTVPRAAWGKVSMLASIDTLDDAETAMRAGYAPALVVAEHTEKRARVVNSVRMIPCPNQTTGITCEECRLCFNADALLKRRAVITFAAHGVRARMIRERLQREGNANA